MVYNIHVKQSLMILADVLVSRGRYKPNDNVTWEELCEACYEIIRRINQDG